MTALTAAQSEVGMAGIRLFLITVSGINVLCIKLNKS